jgi:hypothetical protein
VVIVTEGLWRRFFNADRDILNRNITLNGRSVAVIGDGGPAARWGVPNSL